MRDWLAVGLVTVMSTIVSQGCSSSSPTTLSEFCAEKAQLECQYVQPVCEGLTSSTCVSTRTAACQSDAAAATQNGERTFNPNNISACLSAITSAYGSLMLGQNESVLYSTISGPAGNNSSTVDYLCESVFQGSVGANGTCTTSYDCVSPDICAAAPGAKVEVCSALTPVQDQAPCGNPGDVCVSGDSCIQSKATGEYLCQPSSSSLGGPDAPCTSDADCDPTTAGFCDIYAPKHTCQAAYQFGLGYDCQPFGGTAP